MVPRLRGSVATLGDVAMEDMMGWRLATPSWGREEVTKSNYVSWMAACRKTIHLGKEIEMEWTSKLALSGKDVAASHRAQGSIFFVGNASVILSHAGFTILTDPNFLHRGDHVHLAYGMTAARRTDPALELEALPPIDFVLLSHMHKDHFDREVDRSVL
jgi:hypothetical protein